MISSPSYDPNAMDQNRLALIHDEYRHPLTNRALESYQPGSTVKPLLATAGLTEGVITPETTIVCNGYLFPDRPKSFRCSIYVETNFRATHGPLQLEDAIAQSCNIYFYTLGGRLGIDRITNWFKAYGFGQDTGCELHEDEGSLPNLSGRRDPTEDGTEALLLGIGESHVAVTPLQMANAYATLLRGGLAISPRIVLGNPPQRQQRFQLDPNVVATVRAGMEGVVTRGTAKEIFRGMHLPIAGKTGTADTSRPAFDDNGQPLYDTSRPILDVTGHPRLDADGRPLYHRASQPGTDAWFVAYAPADNPQYVVAAVMEFGGFGGKAAAPMVKEALLQMERHGYLEKMDVPE
jgi:penicillin-binding protein 2